MSDIEKKILDNLAFFEDKEPDLGHRDRFLKKLAQNEPKKRSIGFDLVGKIAASLVFLVAISYIAMNYILEAKTENLYITQIAYADDMVELTSYYDRLSKEKLDNIDNIAVDEKEAEKLKKRATKKMNKLDANLAMIEKEYANNPECKKLKKAIIDNKKKKVEIVDNIVEQVSNSRKGYHVGTMFNEF